MVLTSTISFRVLTVTFPRKSQFTNVGNPYALLHCGPCNSRISLLSKQTIHEYLNATNTQQYANAHPVCDSRDYKRGGF